MNPSQPQLNHLCRVDPVVEKLYETFGYEALFLPLAKGEPVNKDWKRTTLNESFKAPYQRQLWDHDLGVLCGPNSGGLCAIRFDDDVALDVFRKANAGLKTLITRDPTGPVVWVRVPGFTPETGRFPDCGWIADGFIPLLRRKPRIELPEILSDTRPAMVTFDALRWSRLTTISLRPLLVADKFGASFTSGPGRLKQPNVNFWARYFAEENLVVAHNGVVFRFHRPGRPPSPLADDEIKGLMLKFLAFYGNHSAYEGVMSLAQPKGLRLMLAALPAVTAGEFPPEADLMAGFLEECLEPAPGANVTTAEIYEAHCAYFRARDATPLLETVFERTIPALLQTKFGVLKSHSLERDGKSRRGFCHLKLKANDHPGTPGTDGTPPTAEQSSIESGKVIELRAARAMMSS